MTLRRYSGRPLRRNGEGVPSLDLFEWANRRDPRRFGLEVHRAQLVSTLSGLGDGGEP
jgi:hypothetical protein